MELLFYNDGSSCIQVLIDLLPDFFFAFPVAFPAVVVSSKMQRGEDLGVAPGPRVNLLLKNGFKNGFKTRNSVIGASARTSYSPRPIPDEL